MSTSFVSTYFERSIFIDSLLINVGIVFCNFRLAEKGIELGGSDGGVCIICVIKKTREEKNEDNTLLKKFQRFSYLQTYIHHAWNISKHIFCCISFYIHVHKY